MKEMNLESARFQSQSPFFIENSRNVKGIGEPEQNKILVNQHNLPIANFLQEILRILELFSTGLFV